MADLEGLEEVVALADADAADANAQQSFHAVVFPAKHGAVVIKYLTATFGSLVDIGYPHLKRIKKHDTIAQHLIALVIPATTTDVHDQLSSDQLTQLTTVFNGSLCVVDVLKRGPRTREECEIHTKSWPLIFHASVAQEATVEPVTVTEVQAMKAIARRAVDIGQRFREQSSPARFCCATGCIIADPNGSAIGYADVADSLEHHANEGYAYKPIFHPVMVALDGVAIRDRERDSGEGPMKKQRRDLDGSTGEATAVDTDSTHESYVCTGYDVFVDVEPCAMCAMALVHSRARRVIFTTANPTDGALMSVHRLHTIKSLNHHYRVFHLRLETTH